MFKLFPRYSTKVPYSGMWELLPNINVSNRVNGAYNTNQRTWYIRCTQEFPCFGSEETEGIWYADIPTEYNHESDKIGEFDGNIRGKAWAGITDDQGRTPKEMWVAYREEVYATCGDLLTYLDNEYEKAMEFFGNKFTD